jgi:hypothetical protein
VKFATLALAEQRQIDCMDKTGKAAFWALMVNDRFPVYLADKATLASFRGLFAGAKSNPSRIWDIDVRFLRGKVG